MSETVAMPFAVPEHAMMLVRVPGKLPGTVLTLEKMLYTIRLCEYTEPLYIGRSWCYEDFWAATEGLAGWMLDEAATEPTGWVKATDFEGGYRVRRARIVDGERVITEDIPK